MTTSKGAIGICVPERFYAPWEFVSSMLRLNGKYPVRTATGSVIEDNRNWLFRRAKELNEDWVLMIDSDMVFTTEDVDKIIKQLDNKDIVTGLYMRGSGHITPNLYDLNLEPVLEVPNEPFEVGACGAGFLAFNKNVFKLSEPFEKIKVNETVYGEDVSFCVKARENGFKVWCDPSISVGHLRTNVLVYSR